MKLCKDHQLNLTCFKYVIYEILFKTIIKLIKVFLKIKNVTVIIIYFTAINIIF